MACVFLLGEMDIVNYALARIGKPDITVGDTASPSYIEASRVYERARAEVLRLFNWPLASKEVPLVEVDAPVWESPYDIAQGEYARSTDGSTLYLALADVVGGAYTDLENPVLFRAVDTVPDGMYIYAYPSDCLKMVDVIEDDSWIRRGQFIYSYISGAVAKYQFLQVDPAMWSTTIRDMVSMRLASMICYQLTQSMELYQLVGSEYASALQLARQHEIPDSQAPHREPTPWSEVG